MTREQIIERAKQVQFSSNIRDYIDFVVEIAELDNITQEELNKAAEDFAHGYDNGTCDGVAQDCFKAGAEWAFGQFESMGTFPVEDARGGYWPTEYFVRKK